MDLSVLRGGFSTSGPPANRPTRPPAWRRPVSRSTPRGGLLHRLDRRGIDPSASRPTPRGARRRPKGDRAYDADWIRQWCNDKGIESAIPVRGNVRDGLRRPPTSGDQKYRDRNTVERCARHLKERRRLAVRYEKKVGHSRATASSHDPLGVRPGIPEQIIIRRSLTRWIPSVELPS